MENNKLTQFNLSGKAAKKISALCAAGLLFLTPLFGKSNTTLNPQKQIENLSKNYRSNKTQNAIDKFSSIEAEKVLKNTLANPLRNMKTATLTNVEAMAQLAEVNAENIAMLLNVSDIYHQFAVKNLVESGMAQEMYEYAIVADEKENAAVWNKHNAEENLRSRSFFAPMQVELGLKSETGALTTADEVTFNKMDSIDGENEYTKVFFKNNGPRNVYQEVNAVTTWVLEDICGQIYDTYRIMAYQNGSSKEGAAEFAKRKTNEFKQYINNIKKIVMQDNLTDKDLKNLDRNMNDAVNVMPAKAFGTTEMRGALIDALTSIFGVQKIQQVLIKLNYNLDKNQAEAYTQAAKTVTKKKTATVTKNTVKTSHSTNIQKPAFVEDLKYGSDVLIGNKRTTIVNEIDYTLPGNLFNYDFGVQVNPAFAYKNSNFDSSTQILAKAGATTKPTQNGWTFGAKLGTGAEIFYNNGAAFLLDGDLSVSKQISNSNVKIGGSIGGSYGFSQTNPYVSLRAMASVLFKTSWGTFSLGIGYEHVFTKNQGYTPTPTPAPTPDPTPEKPGQEAPGDEQLPDEPTYGGDDVVDEPVIETPGPITDLPVIPDDLSR